VTIGVENETQNNRETYVAKTPIGKVKAQKPTLKGTRETLQREERRETKRRSRLMTKRLGVLKFKI
jgi:hypothetical protein